jgi:deazaflavin-dependent oxidoreductase (nitroreductase family)
MMLIETLRLTHSFLLTFDSLYTYPSQNASYNLGPIFVVSDLASLHNSTANPRSSILSAPINNPGWFTRLALRIASTPFGGWFFTTITPFIDRFLLKNSVGRYSLAGLGAPTLLLTTTGRTSGLSRQTPLLYLQRQSADGQAQLLVIGSRGGRQAHAHWYLNLSQEPVVEVTLLGSTSTYEAREARGDDWQVLWTKFVSFNPGFERYRARVNRHIPIVILTPQEQL